MSTSARSTICIRAFRSVFRWQWMVQFFVNGYRSRRAERLSHSHPPWRQFSVLPLLFLPRCKHPHTSTYTGGLFTVLFSQHPKYVRIEVHKWQMKLDEKYPPHIKVVGSSSSSFRTSLCSSCGRAYAHPKFASHTLHYI